MIILLIEPAFARISPSRTLSDSDMRILSHASEVQMVKCLSVMRETWVQSLGQEDPPGEGGGNHSSILAWRIPWRRSLVGYSPWARKESDTPERLHFHFYLTPLQVGAIHLPKVAAQTALENQGLIGQRASQECLFCHRRSAQQITLWGITYSTHLHTHTLTGTHTHGAATVHVPASSADPC